MTVEWPPKFPVDPYLRKQPWIARGKGPNGRPLCFSGCGREVPKYARTRCSDGCASAWAITSDAGTIRRMVKERDKGVCAICSVDTARHAQVVREHIALWEKLAYREFEDQVRRKELVIQAWSQVWDFVRPVVDERLKENGWERARYHLWEADHIIPVIEGGGGCGLDGYRTLCMKCHHIETAKLAARRAIKRKTTRQPELCL